MDELTVDKCVLTHCDSAAIDAALYRDNGLAFIDFWKAKTSLVACLNPGIRKEYSNLSPAGVVWWRSVVGQSRYRDKTRCVSQAQRLDFRRKQKVPLHGEDFDYVDAASQSSSSIWLCNENTWQNGDYRQRIRGSFGVTIQNVNEYMPTAIP